MERDRHKRLYNLHSWVGILLGLFIFIVSFTGTIALFVDELAPWENPASRLSVTDDRIAFEPVFQNVRQQLQAKGNKIGFMLVNNPSPLNPYYRLFLNYSQPNKKAQVFEQKWNASTGEVIASRGGGLSKWILDFHTNLMLPSTIGHTIVGIAGIFMLLSTITGIFIHGKIIREFFTLRITRSQRLKWQDSHKVLGIIGLPFSIMISFTGALLGVVSILGPIVAVIAFQGNTELLFEKVLGKHAEPTGEMVQMLDIDEVLQIAHPDTGLAPEYVILENYGDKIAHFELVYRETKILTEYERITISGATGEGVGSSSGREILTPANRAVNATVPLHYATFGGIWLKWIYAFMGASLCILIATGLMLWVERRQYGPEGSKSDRFYNSISRLNIGVCFGLPLATIALFYHDKLYVGAEDARLYWTGVTYFTAILAVIIFCQLQKNDYKTSKGLLVLCGGMLLGLPILNAITTGARLWTAQSVGQSMSNGVDISLFLIGIVTLVCVTQIPVKRNEKVAKKQQKAESISADRLIVAE